MRPKGHVVYKGNTFLLETWASTTMPREGMEKQNGVKQVLGDGEAFIDVNDDLWIRVDSDGYYYTFQRVRGQQEPLDKTKLN